VLRSDVFISQFNEGIESDSAKLVKDKGSAAAKSMPPVAECTQLAYDADVDRLAKILLYGGFAAP